MTYDPSPEFIERGDKLFSMLSMNLEEVIASDTIEDGVPVIRHFTISPIVSDWKNEVDELNEIEVWANTFFEKWIQKERKDGRLLVRENWRTHHDYEEYRIMNMTYRYLFPFDNMFFQVRMNSTLCFNASHTHRDSHIGCLEIVLHSWIHPTDKELIVTPWGELPIPSGLMEVPEDDWTPIPTRYDDAYYGYCSINCGCR